MNNLKYHNAWWVNSELVQAGAVARFLWAYLKSMRLYYSFVTGIAGWLGVIYYEYVSRFPSVTFEVTPAESKKGLILLLLFLSWGVNQIVNDYLGLEEDRINAPHRPMVTGELEAIPALWLSGVLLVLGVVVTWVYLEPLAVVFLIGGVMLNVVYEYAKAHGIWANIIFGLMISTATLYGACASGPIRGDFFGSDFLSVLLLVVLLNGVMTYYTYFKDYRGDRRAGKNTLIVRYGLKRSRVHALLLVFVPTCSLLLLKECGYLSVQFNPTFILLWAGVFCMHLLTGILFYLCPKGKNSYRFLGINFQACVCGQTALMALFDPFAARYPFVVSFVLVGLLFQLHSDHKG